MHKCEIPDCPRCSAARPSVPQQGQALENVREFFGEYFHAIPDRKYGSEEVIAFCQTYLSRLAASRSEAQEKTCDSCGRFMTEITRHQLGGMRRHSVEVLCEKCDGAPAAGSSGAAGEGGAE